LEKTPAAKNMFSFLKDSNEVIQGNPSANAHAEMVFGMVSTIQPSQTSIFLVSSVFYTVVHHFNFL